MMTVFSKIGSVLISFSFCISAQAAVQHVKVEEQLKQLEISAGGRLGIVALNTGNQDVIRYRAQEHFPMGCTSKVIGVAAVLKKSDAEPQLLQKRIQYQKKDLTNWTPITGKHVNSGMTVAELGAAAVSYSDNTAMNLLTSLLGGVQGMNAFARSIGDTEFSQDHGWPEEAYSGPQDGTDSSTPEAMAQTLQKIALGKVLSDKNRQSLVNWMKATTTGNKRIRAGVPQGWVVGDKTGTGAVYGVTNDIAVIWPPKCKPIVLAMYYSGNKKDAPVREDVLVEATKIVFQGLIQNDRCLM